MKIGATMLEEEFFAELRRLTRRDEWHLNNGGIRRWARPITGWLTEVCPICAVANDLVGSRLALDYRSGAFALGIQPELAARIIQSVDGKPGHDQVLRQRILKACGLA